MASENENNPTDNADSVRRELAKTADRQLRRGRLNQLSDRLTGGPQRPGEQKVGRSPVVFLLSTITVFGFLLAAIFWYINQKNSEDRLLKEAVSLLDQQKYLEAEARFSQFLLNYPRTDSSPAARIGLHRSLVEKYIQTNTPDVVRGMEELRRLVSECADLPGYEDLGETLRRYADRLAYAGAIVGELAPSREALEVSRDATELLRKFSGEAGIPESREIYLQDRQRIAGQAIARMESFAESNERIDALLGAGRTLDAILEREKLLTNHPVLQGDAEVAGMLTRILEAEKTLVVSSVPDSEPDAEISRPPAAVVPSLRTQVAADLTSQGRFLVTYGLDSLSSIDADTGNPRWRTVIGSNAPFAPVAVRGSRDGWLVYSSVAQELWLVADDNGEILWRRSIEGRPVSAPVVVAESTYCINDNNELWRINTVSGQATEKLTFPQPVSGPPAVSPGNDYLLVAGNQTLVYTIGLSPFECRAVSHIPHGPDSVRAGVIAAGRYFLFCDNHQSEQARIRTLDISEEGSLTVVAEDYVDGQVEDPLLLRGYELYVPSSPQRVTAFRVGDEPGDAPLSLVGANQLEEGLLTRMHLLAGPGGQLWMAGRDLRRFRTRANSVELDTAVTAEGIHTQPIQLLEESVFLTSRTAQSASSFFTRVERDQMAGTWRTLLATHVVALTAAAGGDSLLAVADYGEVYRIPLAQLGTDSFVLDTISRFRLPDKLSSAIRGAVLADGRPAAYAGLPEPAMWTFSTSGQLEQRWPLPGVPDLPPAILDEGAVFAISGRLHLTGLSGGRRAEDFLSARNGDNQKPWKSLVALSGTQVLGVNADNELVRVEYRSAPSPALAEISTRAFQYQLEQPLAAGEGFVAAATADGKLVLLQASSLQQLAIQELGGVASGPPRISGGLVFVDVAGRGARIFQLDSALTPVGEIPLDGFSTIGVPLQTDTGYLYARQDGTLFLVGEDGVPAASTLRLGQQLQAGFVRIGDHNVVTGLDGSLYSINSNLQP